MSKELQTLFDYQRIRKNKKLDAVIRETLGKTSRELNSDELDRVNAAGAIYNETNGVLQITTATNSVIIPPSATAVFSPGICEYKDALGETKQGQYIDFVGNRTDAEKEELAKNWCKSQGFVFVKVVQ